MSYLRQFTEYKGKEATNKLNKREVRTEFMKSRIIFILI